MNEEDLTKICIAVQDGDCGVWIDGLPAEEAKVDLRVEMALEAKPFGEQDD